MNQKQTRKLWFIVRFLIIIIPVILSFLFLFSPFEEIPLTREKNSENLTMVKVSEEDILKPSLKTTLSSILAVPFDLMWYEICFVNKDTKSVYENGETDKNVNVSLNFNNQTEFHVPYGETKCITYKIDKDFTYKWHFEQSISINKMLETSKEKFIPINETNSIKQIASVTMHRDVNTYAKPELRDIIVKNILFFFAWSGLVLLFLEILNFIRFGKKG